MLTIVIIKICPSLGGGLCPAEGSCEPFTMMYREIDAQEVNAEIKEKSKICGNREGSKAGSKSQCLKKSIQQRTDPYRTIRQMPTSVLSKLDTAMVSSVPRQEKPLEGEAEGSAWDKK